MRFGNPTIGAMTALTALMTLTFALGGCGAGNEPVSREGSAARNAPAARDSGAGPYDVEYPAIGYASTEPGGELGRFAESVAAGDIALAYDADRGYLDSVLAALGIDVSSQVLVFSRTSLQTRQILPATPRAIYFNDDTYVAWAKGAPTFEIAGFDSELGPVFYSFSNGAGASPAAERELVTCLRCHDTYSMTGGGVPRFLLGSGYIGTDGELVSHEAWILTSQATPLRSRWGGWYVTGQHGSQVHLGNIVVRRIEDLQDLEALRIGNIEDLSGLFDSSAYLTARSDIDALMVLEHQVEVQNEISRLRFETVGRLAEEGGSVDAAALAGLVEPLLRAMLMVDEIALTDTVRGSSGFREQFESRGPFDPEGRSLRELDLETRLFRYPMSYLIYSEAFQALPDTVKRAFYARLRQVLDPAFAEPDFARLSPDDRAAIAGILRATLSDALIP